jgi:D-alanyl-D-alanine-carboxypeptidase/D-alanyl-D-alanine-endopeptidase
MIDALGLHFTRTLRRVPAIVVGVLRDDGVTTIALGTAEAAPDPAALCWEIGSITKVFTGLLLAEMAARGEVGLDDAIGRHLPDPVAARLPPPELQPTLAQLACHTSGLPRIPWTLLRRVKASPDPYSQLTEEQVFDCLGPRTRRPRRPRSHYSNFGMGLLGHLLARAAGRPYPALVEQRLLVPLRLTATGVGGGGGTLPVPGFRRGRPTPPWAFGALEGAGALRSTVADLLTFARACLDPPAGTLGEALDLARRPHHRGRLPFAANGLGWMLRTRDRSRRPVEICWHNGGTYGGSSFLAVDLTHHLAVVALGNSGPGLVPPLDGPAWGLLHDLTRRHGG